MPQSSRRKILRELCRSDRETFPIIRIIPNKILLIAFGTENGAIKIKIEWNRIKIRRVFFMFVAGNEGAE